MGHIWRDKERFAFSDEMVHDAVAFADAHLNVALELIEIFLRIDEMKIIPRVWPLDDHHEKIAPIVEITIAYRRFEFVAILFDPILQINRRLHSGHDKQRIWCGAQRQTAGIQRANLLRIMDEIFKLKQPER